MLKGGYQIIDFKNVNLTNAEIIIPGIYEMIEGNYRKPLILSGLVINGSERIDLFAPAPLLSEDSYSFPIYSNVFITINSDDTVFLKSAQVNNLEV